MALMSIFEGFEGKRVYEVETLGGTERGKESVRVMQGMHTGRNRLIVWGKGERF